MIYILDTDPKKIAEYIDDNSLDNIIKDISQALCNVHYELQMFGFDKTKEIPLDVSIDYTHHTIEWSLWATKCVANYEYLVELGLECCYEYWFRFVGKCPCCEEGYEELDCICLPLNGQNELSHKMQKIIDWVQNNIPDLPSKNCELCHGKRRILCQTHNDGQGYYETCTRCIEKLGDIGFISTGISNKPTPFPLVMPKKYINVAHKYQQDDMLYCVIDSYRNYYQAKLKNKLAKCNSIFESANELSGGSYKNNDRVEIKWTKREKPDWLKI